VHINRRTWPGWKAEDAGFASFCKQMLHEYGHFEGREDTGAAPGTIEYERPELAHVPACESFRLVYGHEVFVGHPARSVSPSGVQANTRARRSMPTSVMPPEVILMRVGTEPRSSSASSTDSPLVSMPERSGSP
jgi:hypothetical protein